MQIFAQRILFNLEGFEFTPEDAEAWQWRKNYRVWEAARKVFLYPENWLEPEFRDNKSVFFEELEDGLSQDDINLTTAERLYHEYLAKLDQVSRLEIMGMYEDTWTVNGDLETNVLHVFGRTKDVPALYYYRRCEDQARWTPWEPVPLDIQAEHLIPIVFNGRLYVFWPDFKLTPLEPDIGKLVEEIDELLEQDELLGESIITTNEIINNLEDPNGENYGTRIMLEGQVALLRVGLGRVLQQLSLKIIERDGIIRDTPANEVEIGMAWSTYSGGRWSAKRLASSVPAPIGTDFLPKDFYFTGWTSSDNRLYLAIRANRIVETDRRRESTLGISPSTIVNPSSRLSQTMTCQAVLRSISSRRRPAERDCPMCRGKRRRYWWCRPVRWMSWTRGSRSMPGSSPATISPSNSARMIRRTFGCCSAPSMRATPRFTTRTRTGWAAMSCRRSSTPTSSAAISFGRCRRPG